MPLIQGRHQPSLMHAEIHSLRYWLVRCVHTRSDHLRWHMVWTYRYTACDRPTLTGHIPIRLITPVHSLHRLLVHQRWPVLLMPLIQGRHQPSLMHAEIHSRRYWLVGVSTPDPITCDGTVVWTYRYTACDRPTVDWTYTYTIDYTGTLTAPPAGTSTVACAADAVDPGGATNHH